MDLYGQNKKALFTNTDAEVKLCSPGISPDGKLIGFSKKTSNSKKGLYIMNADGSNVRQITSNSGYSITDITKITDWSNDGKRLLVQGISIYSSGGKFGPDIPATIVKEINIDGSLGKFSRGYASPTGGSVSNVKWSYDEKFILFHHTPISYGNPSGIYVCDADGNNQHLVFKTSFAQWVKSR